MRVIAGDAKGKRLKTPKGYIRPTTELVRGAIFSIIQSLVGQECRVLDLFAGSGALGIEALSRGAGWVDFVENNPRHCAVIKSNLASTGFLSRGKVHCISAEKAIAVLDGPYGLITLDPPYEQNSIARLLASLVDSQQVDSNSVIVVEYSCHHSLPSEIGEFGLYKDKQYGDTCISIYRQEVN